MLYLTFIVRAFNSVFVPSYGVFLRRTFISFVRVWQ